MEDICDQLELLCRDYDDEVKEKLQKYREEYEQLHK